MPASPGHRKRVTHYHEPGHVHELTWSCHGRQPLLLDDRVIGMLCTAIDRAIERHRALLFTFVIMPEHVHLIVGSQTGELNVSQLLAAIKRPFSYRVRQLLSNTKLLESLTVWERPGKRAFRFWQEGSGYDRNLLSSKVAVAAIDYAHANPVRRGLCDRAVDWRWSSARWYVSDGLDVDPALPRLSRMPAEFLRFP